MFVSIVVNAEMKTQIQTIQSDMSRMDAQLKEVKADMRSLVTAFRGQTELVMEQQRQIKESL